MDNPGSTTHGMSGTSEYYAWTGMIQRCTNPNHPGWDGWGGRGIMVCDRWRYSFENFLEDVGRKSSPELTLERMDNNKGYEPGNVCWATFTKQADNRRSRSKYGSGIQFDGHWYRVYIKINRVKTKIGTFRTLEEAKLARAEAEKS